MIYTNTIRFTEVSQPLHETVTPQPERGIGEDANVAPHSTQQSTARLGLGLLPRLGPKGPITDLAAGTCQGLAAH